MTSIDNVIFDTNWNNLSNELKCMIIPNLDPDTRKALRQCSSSDKRLIDKFPYTNYTKLWIFYHKVWIIRAYKKNIRICDVSFQTKSLDEVTEKLRNLLKYVDQIRYLKVDMTNCPNPFKLHTNPYQMRITELALTGSNSSDAHSNILKQVEPIFLKKMGIFKSKMINETFNLPQIIHLKEIVLSDQNMAEDQLLNLEARNIHIERCNNITAASVNKIIKKSFKYLEEGDDDEFNFFIVFRTSDISEAAVLEGVDVVSEETKTYGGKRIVVKPPNYSKHQLEVIFNQVILRVTKILNI